MNYIWRYSNRSMPVSVALSLFSYLLPIVVFLILLKKIKSWQLWVIFLYSFYSFSNDSVILYRDSKGLYINHFLYIFTVLEYLLLATYFWSIIQTKRLKTTLIVLTVLFASFCIFNILTKPYKSFDSVQTSIEAILLIAYCIVYLFEEVNKPQITFIYSSFHFWIVIAILIYFSATFFLFVYANSLPLETAQDYWIISHFSNILKNIFFATAFIIYAKKPSKPNKQHPTEYQPFLN